MHLIAPSNPILRMECQDVTDDFDEEQLHTLVTRMQKLMDVSHGTGIAAPQVGLPLRLCLIRTRELLPGKLCVMVNPKIVDVSSKLVVRPEACLSFPGTVVSVSRPEWVRVQYIEYSTREMFNVMFTGLDAQCVCHELDHLDGTVLTDYDPDSQEDVYVVEE